MNDATQSKTVNYQSSSSKSLWLAKSLICVIAVGMILVGNRVHWWPMITWPMYWRYNPQFPSATTSALQIRAISTSGETFNLMSGELLLLERDSVTNYLSLHAFEEPDETARIPNCIGLVNLVRHTLPEIEIERVELWRLSWDVQPLQVPPLNRQLPSQETLLGKVAADNTNIQQECQQ